MNSIQLIGRLTADVELRQTQSGVSVCQFNLAVDRPKVKDTTDFIPCVAWRGTAEFICKYFGKGNKIALNGVLTTRKWQDQNGNNRVAYEVLAESVEFCESKQNNAEQSGAEQYNEPTEPTKLTAYDDSDLPF